MAAYECADEKENIIKDGMMHDSHSTDSSIINDFASGLRFTNARLLLQHLYTCTTPAAAPYMQLMLSSSSPPADSCCCSTAGDGDDDACSS